MNTLVISNKELFMKRKYKKSEVMIMIDEEHKPEITEEKVKEEYEKGFKEAEKLLANPDKLETFLQKLEKKLKVLPVVGTTFAIVPAMISLVRSYVKKEYTEVPLGTIVVP